MNEDLVLLIAPAAPREPHAVVERQEDGSAVAAVSFLPELDAGPRMPREVIFLIDRSGSMGGGSIEEAKRALQLCLRSLQEGDRFDIISFGSHHESMFGKCRPYSQTSLEEAAALCESDRRRHGRHRDHGPAGRGARADGRGHAAGSRAADRRRGHERRCRHRPRGAPRRIGEGLHHRHRPRPERALHQRRRPRERRRCRVHQTGRAHRAQGAAAVRAARRRPWSRTCGWSGMAMSWRSACRTSRRRSSTASRSWFTCGCPGSRRARCGWPAGSVKPR